MYPTALSKLKFNEALKRMINRFVGDLITNTQGRVKQARVQTLEDVRGYPQRLADFSPAVDAERQEAKDFLYENLYFSSALADEKDDAERVVGELFGFWMEHPQALPHNYQARVKEEDESLSRVICDYIAGMTDNFILEQYEKHCGE